MLLLLTTLIRTSRTISGSHSIVGRNNGLSNSRNENDLPARTGIEGVYSHEATKID